MRCFYSVFGLHIRSNRLIPGLVEAIPFDSPDIEVYLGAVPEPGDAVSGCADTPVFASSILLESGEPVWRLWKSSAHPLFRLEYSDGVQFWINSEANAIWAIWPEQSSLEDAATYLLGPVLGFALRLRGVICLHASSVNLCDHAIAFVGDAGAGKSTTVAALASRGYALLSDDIVALSEQDRAFFVQPAYPYVGLWPESVTILYGSAKILAPLSPNYEKRQLRLAEHSLKFEERPMPLAVIYLLGERSTEDRAPFVSVVSRRESLISLVANSYTNLDETELRAQEFELLGRLVGSVPVRRLHAHRDGSRVDGLCELIEHDAAAIFQDSDDTPILSGLAVTGVLR